MPVWCRRIAASCWGRVMRCCGRSFARRGSTLRQRDGVVRRILVFFGGADPSNETAKALRAIQRLDRPEIAVDVVVGAANPHRAEIEALCAELPNASFPLPGGQYGGVDGQGGFGDWGRWRQYLGTGGAGDARLSDGSGGKPEACCRRSSRYRRMFVPRPG